MPSPPSAPRTHAPTLPELLSAYESYAGVVVHWLVFGSSHHTSAPKGLVVENFAWRAADAHEVIKTIVQPSKIAVVGGHNHQYIAGRTAVNDLFKPIPFNQSSGESACDTALCKPFAALNWHSSSTSLPHQEPRSCSVAL